MNKPNKFTFYAPLELFAMAFPLGELPEGIDPFTTVRVDWVPAGSNKEFSEDTFTIRSMVDEQAILVHYTGPDALRIAVLVDEENQ